MRPFFIVNPIAGGGEAKESFNTVRSFLDVRGVEYGFVFTEEAGESVRLTEEAYKNGERFIVSVGGDGTLSEVAQALCGREDAVLGICPFGTGNDFVRTLGIPKEPEKAAELLLSGTPKPVDMGLAGERPFINVAGFGFDVDVVINTERYKGKFRGMLPYLLGVMKSMLHLRGIKVKLTADGNVIEDNILLLAAANGTHFGGGMAVAPMADPSDGYFDVCYIKKLGLLKFLWYLPSFVKGKHVGSKPFVYFRAKELKVECESTPLQLDGELKEHTPISFRILESALRIVC